jgi:hypothetical protein
MARQIEVADDALRIRYRGLDRWVVLQREVAVPYAQIESVEVGLPELPKPTVRIGSYHRRSTLARGRFKVNGRWLFLDLRHLERVVVLHLLPGARFALVGIEPDDDPAALAARIRERL